MNGRPFFAAVVVLLCATFPASAVTVFNATLSGDQEVPPVASAASGTATLQLNDIQDQLTISIQLFGLDLDGNQTATPDDDVTAFHIHDGDAGVNGPVVFGFISPNNDLNGDLTIDAAAGTVFSVWDLNEGNNTTLGAQLADLFNTGLYFNAHTPANPGGEIRGQIVPEPTSGLVALIGLTACWTCRRRRRR